MNDFIKWARDKRELTTTELEDYQKWMNRFKGLQMNNAYDFISAVQKPEGMTPNIIEESQMRIAVMDVFSRLMKDRMIFLGTGIDSQISNIVVSQLLYLENVDSTSDIQIIVSSPGGSVYDGLGIYDTMQYVKPKVGTLTTAMAASMGYVLATAGEKGMRSALPHSRFMQHQPLGGAQGQATDMQITMDEMFKLKYELYEIIAHHTGQDIETIWQDAERDHWMRAEEAVEYGVIDSIQSLRGNGVTLEPLSSGKWEELNRKYKK